MHRLSRISLFYGGDCGGKKEKESLEAVLSSCSDSVQKIYEEPPEGNG